MKIRRVVKISLPLGKYVLLAGMVLMGAQTVSAQVQHPRAARRIHVHRVHTHRENVAGAVHDRRENVAGAVHERRENVVDVRRERVDNVADRRAAVRTARAILPTYVPATVASSGSIVCPPAPVVLTEPVAAATLPPAENPPADSDAYEGLASDEMPDTFEGSPSYPVVRIEDGGVTVVLKVGDGETKVRLLGVASVNLGDRVEVPERFAGMRLPSTERFVDQLLKSESVYVVYDTQVAEEDADKKCVAYLFRAPDGLAVNLEIIRAGFGVADLRYDFDQKEAFTKYQDLARKADKGIYGIVHRMSAKKANAPK